jgi:hypothetical protein
VNIWRYQTGEQVEIDAPIDRVYAVASDPEVVPSYAPEIARIEVVERLSEHTVIVRSYLKVANLTLAYLYRYHYRAPTHYSGVQEHGKILRGFFTLAFTKRGDRTAVVHTEGFFSAIPCFAWIIGFIYFQIVARGGVAEELGKLKELIESGRN